MAIERIKCTECDTMLLARTSGANAGLCEKCLAVPEWLRRKRREFQSKLESGSWFIPSDKERGSAKRPAEFDEAATRWSLEPEYYANCSSRSITRVFREAMAQSRGYVLFDSNLGGRLNLAFNEVYGVCEYQNDETHDFLYAYTSENLREQVSSARHLEQECAGDGFVQVWYPSRFHLPRRTAFKVLSHVVFNDPPDAPNRLEWLAAGDISFTMPGTG